MTTFTREQKRKCLARELAFRRNVYAKRVKAGSMNETIANREIALMQAILDDYTDPAEPEFIHVEGRP